MNTEVDKQSWNQFVSSAPGGSFLQSWEWGEMQKKLGVPYWRFNEGEGESVHGAALVIKRQLPWGKCWLYVPRGPLMSSASKASETSKSSEGAPGLAGQLVSLAQQEKAVFVRAEPAVSFDSAQGTWRKAANDVQPRHTLLIDLKKTEEELLGEMRQKTRYNIRLAGKKDVTFRFSTDANDLDHFIKLSSDVHERSAFRYHPEEYYRAMLLALRGAAHAEIALAEHEGDILAAHILVSFGDTVTYVHGASSSSKRDLMAPHLLQWESIRRAKEKGFAKYDFFGVAPVAVSPPAGGGEGGGGSKHPWDGITKFKEGFGGYRVDYLGAYDYILDPVWYWTYATSRKVKSLLR